MKIVMTIAELTDLVRRRYDLPNPLTLEVLQGPHPDAENLRNALKSAALVDVSGLVFEDRKIAAIKLLREIVPNCGLAQAKWAIEDLRNFMAHVSAHGFPKMASDEAKHW